MALIVPLAGKNCPECGLFLWDTRSFIKHMKRNHGLKVKEKDKVKEKGKEKTGASKDENSSSASADLSGRVLKSKESFCVGG